MSLITECHHCFFDLDGTLVDSNEAHVETWDRAFRHFGKKFTRDQLRAQIGKGSDQYLPIFLTPTELKRFGNELDKYRSKLFKEEYLAQIKPFPKVRRLFEYLKEAGKELMLVTSGKQPETEHYLKLLEIEKLIVGYTSADDANQSKPAPDLFHVGIVGCEKNAKVPGYAGKNQGLSLQVAEQCLESRGEKAGMLWLEHEIIGFLGPQ